MMRETIQMNLPATRGITTADSACGIAYHIYIYKYMMVCEANENIKKSLQTELRPGTILGIYPVTGKFWFS